MCNKIGSGDAGPAPPEAVSCIRDIIIKHVGHVEAQSGETVQHCSADIDARLLGSWRLAARDPDDAVPQWLLTGVLASISWLPHSVHCLVFMFFLRQKFLVISLFEVTLRGELLQTNNI